jgi:hypothetical protein
MSFKVRTLKKSPGDIGGSIVAVYSKNAKAGDMPLFIGTRRKSREFILSKKEKAAESA